MSVRPSDASRYDAGQFHPEFGYFAPTMRFWSKVWLGLKAVTLGALAGAVGVFFLTLEREERAHTMLATPVTVALVAPKPTQIATPSLVKQSPAASTYTWVPVRFVPESMALPAAAPRASEPTLSLRPSIATAPMPQPLSTVGVSPAASEAAPAAVSPPEPAPVAKAAAKPKKKATRDPEPEPRAAYVAPPRPFGLPIFGFGWQR